MKRLCSICARGGSKGVLGKNLRIIDGKPLIAYTIEHAKMSNLFDAVAVSSDSDEILQVAQDYGVDHVIKRPAELANDTAAKLPVIKHCAQQVENILQVQFDTFVDLDCTSPLRDVSDIINAVEMLEAGGCDNVVTGMSSRRSPYFNLVEKNGSYVELAKKLNKEIVRRQDSPQCYDLNASIYVWSRSSFFSNTSLFTGRTKIYVMPEERSLDIDSEFDFEIVTTLLRKKHEA